MQELQDLLRLDSSPRTRKVRDGQRSKVYAAEREAFKALPDVPRTEDVWNAYVKLLANSKTAHKHFGRGRQLRLKFKGRTWSYCVGSNIRLGLGHRGNEWVVIHEAAHSLTRGDVAPHGREFCETYLDLVNEFLGKTWGDKLKASFKAHGVKFRAKRQLSPERLAQLRQQGKTLAFLNGNRSDPLY